MLLPEPIPRRDQHLETIDVLKRTVDLANFDSHEYTIYVEALIGDYLNHLNITL